MKPLLHATLIATIALSRATHAQAAAAPDWDLHSDTWVATDAVGRELPVGSQVPLPRANRTVGIFYFLWHGHHGTPGPFDISKLIAAQPDAPQLGPEGAFHWWGEPEIGYFRSLDPWVPRRNLSLLQDAGVDVLFLDVTNAFDYPDETKLLFETARQMRAEGSRTPQIAFLAHSHEVDTIQRIYDRWYAKNQYPELWFRWQGKPIILADSNAKKSDGSTYPAAVKDFFNWRYSWAWEPGKNRWPWIDTSPQRLNWNDEKQTPEMLPVAVASHPTSFLGRSFQKGKQPPIDRFALTPTYNQGLYFNEQWQRVWQLDPQFVFITGWNEWVAQRFIVHDASGPDFLGKPTRTGDYFFVDAYNAEFNRDIDPMRGGSHDNLYFQMIANIRRYKGARLLPTVSVPKTIRIDGRFDDWNAVAPQFRDTIGDTMHRDFKGWGDLAYNNNSGRNDILYSRVARDNRNLYFLASTRAALSPRTGANWMLLLLDTDQSTLTGWNGYDFRINKIVGVTRTSLEKYAAGKWIKIADLPYRASGKTLELSAPRRLIGETAHLGLDFKWADNIDANADRDGFFLNGDVAPNRRFNFRYSP